MSKTPKSRWRKWIYAFSFFTGAFVTVTQFQNCAPEGAFESASLNIQGITDLGNFDDVEDNDHDTSKFTAKPITRFVVPMMDRQSTEAVLQNAFGPSWTAESSNIQTRGVEFGKGCSFYGEYNAKTNGTLALAAGAEACRANTPLQLLGTTATANPARSSYLMSACSELSNNSTTLNYFLNKVGSSTERAEYKNETMIKAYEAFYVGKAKPSQTLIDSLKIIGQSQSSSQKAWSAIAFTLCASGQWQVL